MYLMQVDRVLAFAGTGGNSLHGGNDGEKDPKGSKILCFPGTDQRTFQGLIGQLAMKITDEAKLFTN
jgi:hypothetical protein